MKASPVTLEGLNKKIKNLLKDGLDSHWVVAEISELSINYSGHCYLELVQKSDKNEQLIARARAIIWSHTFRMLQPYFETTTGHTFSEGIKVMLRVVVEFHEVYGLSLNVVDIEPTYTVGELAVRKQKIIEKLTKEGVLEMNKELELPYLLNRIAIISSKTAAGLGDFQNQLSNNTKGFKFYTKLFPAIMQGNEAEGSIINQLDNIFQYNELFDAVVIIRGGGASADLECFNSYWLAYNVTQFPIPVLTGIGHEQDDSVVDAVANTRLKTPIAVAEFLINQISEVEGELLYVQSTTIEHTLSILSENNILLKDAAHNLQRQYALRVKKENKKLSQLTLSFISALKNNLYKHHNQLSKNSAEILSFSNKMIGKKKNKIEIKQNSLVSKVNMLLTKGNHQIDKAEQLMHHSNPKNILSKGYSITLKDGKSIKNAASLNEGDTIETIFHKGKKQSTIKK